MNYLERSIFIESTPDIINSTASDARRWPEWYANIEKIAVDSIFPQVGGRVDITFSMMGMNLDVRFIQQQFIPAQKSICRIEGRIQGFSRFELLQEDSGCRAVLALKYKNPGGLVIGFASKFLVKELLSSNLETSLENLKKLVEKEISDERTSS